MSRIGVFTSGLWRLRGEIATLTGMTPVKLSGLRRPDVEAVAGWGHAPTADRARRVAERIGRPYIALEDGPLRSIRPGPAQPPMSLVLDRSGIFYDATTRSDLLALMADADWFTPALMERAKRCRDQLRHLGLSKYNSGPSRTAEQLGLSRGAEKRILVLDQVRDDASIRGALADASSFQHMLGDALSEGGGAEVIVKVHPDVMSGRRQGYLDKIAAKQGLRIIAENINPWSLLDNAGTVFTVSSGLGFEAVLAGKKVVTYGSAFYAGWGFTEDRRFKLTRPRRAEALELFAAYYLRYAHYFDAYSRQEIAFEQALEQLAWLRDRFVAQENRAVCHRISRWKRTPVDRMLDSPKGPPLHASSIAATVSLAEQNSGRVVSWASRNNRRLEEACRTRNIPFIRVEDGFIRSAGLGASFVSPLSLVFDESGIYYDSSRGSDLETILENEGVTPALRERARKLREKLVASGTSKYNVRPELAPQIESGGRPIILVPGQVEDDASIQRGSPKIKRNIDLLRAVRERHPEGFIVYKPHPDVESGFRHGRVPQRQAMEFADLVVVNAPIIGLIQVCDRMETITSLAGFEALLRGKAVTTHGQPFYAGWGLTEDLCPIPRRTRRASIDDLVAAALILYPQYLDPMSGLPCTPELLVERLAAEVGRERTVTERMTRFAQTSIARALYIGQSVKDAVRPAQSAAGLDSRRPLR